jgi:8-oxo-dGTP diphosphatase
VPGVSDGPRLRLTGPGRIVITTVVVTAAVIERDGRFLVTRRQPGVHLAGRWEFPGGKCDPGESLAACMARELREELAVEPVIGDEIFAVTHDYSDRRIELHFLRCTIDRDPAPQLGQEMQWIRRSDLQTLEFPPADADLIRMLAAGR